jgi:hypothetical protein
MLGAAGPVMAGIAGLRGVERQRGAGARSTGQVELAAERLGAVGEPGPAALVGAASTVPDRGLERAGARLDDVMRRGSVAVLGDIGAEDVKRRGEASPTAIPAPARASGPTNSGSATASAAPAHEDIRRAKHGSEWIAYRCVIRAYLARADGRL